MPNPKKKTANNRQTPLVLRKEDNASLPVVGIGASAGGLEAIEQFFTHLPSNSGIAFVIITHLDRTHVSIMPELIKNILI